MRDCLLISLEMRDVILCCIVSRMLLSILNISSCSSKNLNKIKKHRKIQVADVTMEWNF